MLGNISYSVYDTGTIKTLSYVADGGTAIGHKLGSYNSLSTSGAKILSVYSDNFVTEKAYIDKGGNIGFTGNLVGSSGNLYLYFGSSMKGLRVDSVSISGGWCSGHSSYGVVFGYGAGAQLVGRYNTFVGHAAGANVNEYSSCFGYNAGGAQGATKPKRIVCIGASAGLYAKDETVALGYGHSETIFQGNQIDKLAKIIADLIILNPSSLDSEVLDENDFTTSTKWAVTGDVAISGGQVVKSGAGTLTQLSTDFLTPLAPDSWYCFQYENLSGSPNNNTAKSMVITTAIATEEVICGYGQESATEKTHKVFFKTNSSPGNFVLEFFETSSGIFDNFSLKKITGGSVSALSADFVSTTLRSVNLTNVPSGADQATAGAAAGELWIDTDDNILRIGV